MLLGAGRSTAPAASGSASIPSGRLEFWVGDGTAADAVAAEVKLIPRIWYFVAVSYDPASGAATCIRKR